MAHVSLRVQGTESTLAVEELTIDRLLAEARAVALTEFAVMRNGEEIANPDDLIVEQGDVFVILPADYKDAEIIVHGDHMETANDLK